MPAWLRDNPPARSQYRSPRRARPTGLIVVHTAESVLDKIGPDTGAEAVARFIQGRATPGSYHVLVDSDSIIELIDFEDEAYGDGTGSNLYAMHLSAACRTTDWTQMAPAQRAGFIDNMAAAAQEYAGWIEARYGVIIPAHRVTRAQSAAGLAGFISHGERDPGRRSDPGADFPWADFLAAFADEAPPATQPTETEVIVASLPIVKRGARGDSARRVQALLLAAHHAIKVDGEFGPSTHSEVVAYQRHRGLGSDGIIGPRTWRSLLGL